MYLWAFRKINIFGVQLAITASLLAYQPARAQQLLQAPDSELSIPGVAQKSSISTPVLNNSTYTDFSNAEASSMQFKDAIPHTRGAQDVSLFRQAAPAVVLILAKDALGSGSLLQDGVILTNFHAVGHNREVTVVFKPMEIGGKPTADEVVKADIIKIDVQRDLALVHPRSLPNHAGPMVAPFGSMALMSAPAMAGCGNQLVGTQAQRAASHNDLFRDILFAYFFVFSSCGCSFLGNSF